MSERNILNVIEDNTPTSRTEKNVHGWERAGSVFTGIVMLGKGVRRGGIFGLVQIAIGGAILARGVTGHSSTKSLIEKGRHDIDQVRAKIERAGDELVRMKEKAESAVVAEVDPVVKPAVTPKV